MGRLEAWTRPISEQQSQVKCTKQNGKHKTKQKFEKNQSTFKKQAIARMFQSFLKRA